MSAHTQQHALGGSDHTSATLAEINALISDATLASQSWATSTHFNLTNNPHTVTASQLSDFETAVSANADVVLNSGSRVDQTINGFVDPYNEVTCSFDNGTRTLTIEPSSSTFSYYSDGIKYTKSSQETKQIGTDHGLHILYYDGATLTTTTTWSDDFILLKAIVALIYWDATNSKQIYFGREYRHSIKMGARTHEYLHDTVGFRLKSGGALGDIVSDGDGDSDTHAQFSITGVIAFDEDARYEALAKGSTDNIPKYYFDASGNWFVDEDDSFTVITTGTGRAAWNESGVGLTEVGNTDFVLSHVFTTNDTDRPYGIIVGQADYATSSLARDGALTEVLSIITNGLISPEFKFLGTIINQTNNGYVNTVKSRIISTDDGSDYIDLRGEAIARGAISSTINDHNLLVGLQGGQSTEFYHLTSAEYTDLNSMSATIAERTIRYEDRTSNLSAGDSGKFAQYYNGSGFSDATLDGVLLSSLTAGWKFESGALTTDSVGSNTLTNNNSVSEDVSGKNGGCADLENTGGEDQCFTIASVGADLQPTAKMMVSAWINIESWPAVESFLFKFTTSGSSQTGWGFGPFGGGAIKSEIRLNESDDSNVNIATTDISSYLSLATWHHIVFVADGSNIYIYIDGTQRDSLAYDGTIREMSALNIGKNEADAYYFDGKIDEFYFWKDPDLSAGVSTIVSALYNSGTGRFYDASIIDYRITANLQEDNDGNIEVANDLEVTGNVGIGVTPVASVETGGHDGSATIGDISTTASNQAFLVSGSYTADNYYPIIGIRMDDNNPSVVNAGMFAQFTNSGSSLILGGSDIYSGGINSSMIIDPSGNVGIGIAPTDGLLHLSATDPVLAIESDTWASNNYGEIRLGYTADSSRSIRGDYDTGLIFNCNSNYMYFNSSGNTGIGVTPAERLTVSGARRSGTNQPWQVQIIDSASMAQDVGGGIAFSGSYTGTTSTYFAQINAGKENGTDSNYAGYLSLGVRTQGNPYCTEALRIDSNTNVYTTQTTSLGTSNWPSITIGQAAGRVLTGQDGYFIAWNEATAAQYNRGYIVLGAKGYAGATTLTGGLIGGGIEGSSGANGYLDFQTMNGSGTLTSALQISSAQALVLQNNGSSGAPIITWNGDTDIGLYRVEANHVGIAGRTTITSKGGSGDTSYGFVVEASDGTDNFDVRDDGLIYMGRLPTSNPGVGFLWNDSGTIKMGT